MLKYVDVYRCSDGAPWSVTVTTGQARTTPRLRPICNLSRPSPVQGMTNCAWRNAHVHTPVSEADDGDMPLVRIDDDHFAAIRGET